VALYRQPEHALGGEGGQPGPGEAAIGRGDHYGSVARGRGWPDGAEGVRGVQVARVGGVDRDRVDRHAAVAGVGRVVAAEGLVRVVRPAVLHRVLRGIGPHHAPALPRILAAPEGPGAGVDHLRVLRI